MRHWRYLVPNALSALSLLFALLSLQQTFARELVDAAWYIIWCTLLDKADGAAARALGATSAFGAQLDSFADFLAFGIAPAGLVYAALAVDGAPPPTAGLVVAGFALACACRLARFNAATATTGAHGYSGMPSTVAGGLIAAAYLTYVKYHTALQVPPALLPHLATVCVAALALAMVSTYRFPTLDWTSARSVRFGLMVTLAASYVVGFARILPELLLAVASATVGFSLVYHLTSHEARP